MGLLKFVRNLKLGIKLNLTVVLALGMLLAIVLAVMATSLRNYTLQTGQRRVEEEAGLFQQRFEEAEHNLLADTKLLKTTPGLIEALAHGDTIALSTAATIGAAPLGIDRIDAFDADGAHIVSVVMKGVGTLDAGQVDALLTYALIGVDATGVIVENEEGSGFHLAAVVTLRDDSGAIVGALLTSRQVDDEFLADINFSRQQVHLVLIYGEQIVAQHIVHASQSHTPAGPEHAPTTEIPVKTTDLLDHSAIEGALNGQTVVVDHLLFSEDGVPHTMAYTPLTVGGDTQAVISVLYNLDELSVLRGQLTSYLAIIFVLIALVTAGAMVLFTWRTITAPIGKLISVATQVTEGELDARIAIESSDEIGLLASSFNYMTAQLQTILEGLEQRVADRTQALEASAEVSRSLSSILDQEQLVATVVDQVQKAFNHYHAHIYLVDKAGEYLVMAGGTGEAGQLMLAGGHKIPWGKGLVGRAAETNSVVLAPDVSQEEDWLPNPLLPNTQSEIAVPIASGERVLGVLDVQQNVVGGLDQDDADLLGSIAGQVAIALQNTRLFAEARQKAGREERINQIAQRIQSTTTVESALQVAVRELGQVLEAQETSVRLQAAAQPGNGHSKRAPVGHDEAE